MPQTDIEVTSAMLNRALIEVPKREPWIKHHFETSQLDQRDTSIYGFLGEFCARCWLGLDWEAGVRDHYETIDHEDIDWSGKSIDVKTETVPARYLRQVVERTARPDQPYGQRLFHSGQSQLLEHYDIVLWGAFERRSPSPGSRWFPIGWLTSTELSVYPQGRDGPMLKSGRPVRYPFSAYQIPTADLRDPATLFDWTA